MKIIDGLIGGLAGALSVTLIHELTRKLYDGAPRLDQLGEQALSKIVTAAGGDAPSQEKLYVPAMAGDIAANALYYGLAAANAKHPVRTAGFLGLSAGLGAISLPQKLGLNEKYSAGTIERRLITVGLYTIGGLIAGAVVKMIRKEKPSL